VAPTSTPVPYREFADAEVPPADPERLARLTDLLSLVPDNHGAAVYLDVELLRSDPVLSSIITAEVLGLDSALPSIVTGLVNSIAIAADLKTQTLVTAFQSDIAIANLLQFASNFGLPLTTGGPVPHEGHDIWNIDFQGNVLAIGEAGDSTGVAAGGLVAAASEARGLVVASLDAFDGRSAGLLDAPGLSALMADVPSGFAAAALSQCQVLPLLNSVPELPGCTGAVASASLLSDELAVVHALIGFEDEDQAAAAMQLAAGALESQKATRDFEDLGVRQEGANVRARVIVEVAKIADAFQMFAPDN